MLHTKQNPAARLPWVAARTKRSNSAEAAGERRLLGQINVAEPLSTRYSYGYAPVPERSSDASKAPAKRTTMAPNTKLARSETALIPVAVGIAVAASACLVLYLCSYARISSLGMREAAARVQLRQTQEQNEFLLAQYNSLRSPQRIVPAAQALKMQNIASTATYIDLSKAPAQAGPSAAPSPATVAEASAQTTGDTTSGLGNAVKAANSGTTGENQAAAGDF